VKSPDPVLTAQQRADELHDMVSTTATTFLGLTVGCARCHDHKFDPIAQTDYYRMTAIFAGVQHGERPFHPANDSQRVTDLEVARREAATVDKTLSQFLVADSQPAPKRPAVMSTENEDKFAPMEARYVRFTITATNDGAEPCIDELEIFSAGDAPRNVALASTGANSQASGTFPNAAIHKLAHLNDGRYGNSHSWISNERGKGWVTIELPVTAQIDRVVWGRDREGKFKDRLPTAYKIEVATTAQGPWQLASSSADRTPLKPPEPKYVATTSAKQEQLNQLLARKKSLAESIKRLATEPMAYAGTFTQPGPTFRLQRGDPMAPREPVTPGGLAILSPALDLPAGAPEQQRRLAFARSLTDPSNPLVARVIVNRLWHYHFGRGLVATPSDFGHVGAAPTHRELLDFLASELIANHWHLKPIHRLIVTSAAYRQSSAMREEARAVDADSTLLWRYPPRRLEAEAIRDSVLAVSGKLDFSMGGPGFDVFTPNDNYVRIYDPREDLGPEHLRRMVYQFKPRLQPDGLFSAFDAPDGAQVTPRRSVSTTPLQALNLLNSRFMLQQSMFFAERLKREAGADAAAQVALAFRLAFARAPADVESTAAVALIREHGLSAFCRALFNTNEFVYVH
jgi:hypothetical protein